MRVVRLMLAVALAAIPLYAATSPFVGDWKLDAKRTKLFDTMKVERVSGDTYAFDFGGGAETIAVDGKDHPGAGGTQLSVAIQGPNAWRVVRKKDGQPFISANWTLSSDGKSLTDDFTLIRSDGSPSSVKYVYKKTAGGAGFAGTWEGVSVKADSYVLKIHPYEQDGLTIIDPSQQITRNLKIDGGDYPDSGPTLPPGVTATARRVNDRTLEVTDKFKGKPVETEQLELSADGKTLTVTMRTAAAREANILVFERS